MSRAELSNLSHQDLVEQYSDLVRWFHYDPHAAPRPSEFDLDDLQEELLRRLEGPASKAENEED